MTAAKTYSKITAIWRRWIWYYETYVGRTRAENKRKKREVDFPKPSKSSSDWIGLLTHVQIKLNSKCVSEMTWHLISRLSNFPSASKCVAKWQYFESVHF